MNVRLTQAQKIQLLNSEDVYKIMQQILLRENKIGRNQEHFWVIGLDNQNKILFIEQIGLGTVNRVNANPPDVFRMGIYKLAVKMILVHNHPSGNLSPSDADINLTDRMLKVGNIINIDVIEHLIISEKDYTSFADEGILKELKENGRYEIIDSDKAELQAYKAGLEKKRIEKQKAITIGKKLKKEGIDDEFIKKVTGLANRDIKKL